MEPNGVGSLTPLQEALVSHAQWVTTLMHSKLPEGVRLSLIRRAQRSAELAVECESAIHLELLLALCTLEDVAICAQSCIGYLEELGTIRCLGELSNCVASEVAEEPFTEIDSLAARLNEIRSHFERILCTDALQRACQASGTTEAATLTRIADALSTSK